MELPVEIIQNILTTVSFQDACKAKMISRSWRDAATDLLHRGIFQKKTAEERAQYFTFKLKKNAKKSEKKHKLLKGDLDKQLAHFFAMDTLSRLQAEVGLGRSAKSFVELWLYAEDEMGLWEHFDDIIAKSDKVHIRSPLIRFYLQLRCSELYELCLDLLDTTIEKYADLSLEVDPSKGGGPENAENLIKVCKQYFDALFVELKKMDKGVVGWLQHIYKKESSIKCIKAILVLHLLSPSILAQSSERFSQKKGPKKPKKDPAIWTRKYILVCKILSSSMLGNRHKERFLSGADAFTLQVAEQLENVTKELLAMEVNTSNLFHPHSISVADILEALSAVKETDKPVVATY